MTEKEEQERMEKLVQKAECAETYLILRTCKNCGKICRRGYCCLHCGSDNE